MLAVAWSVAASAGAQAATGDSVTAHVLMSPVALDLTITPSTAKAGAWVGALVTVRNIGPAGLARVAVRLRAPTGLVLRPASARSIRRLAAGSTKALSWALCGRAPGAYLVFAEASFDGIIVVSATRLVSITAGSGACSTRRA